MSRTTDAHDRMVESQARWTGEDCEATIGTQTVPAFVMTDPYNPTIVDGGTSNSGQQTIRVNKSLLTDFEDEPNGEPPINTTPTVVRGVSAFVTGVSQTDGILYITTGFPAAEDY